MSVLRGLVRAMATEQVARRFVAEYSEELSSIPQAVYLAAKVAEYSSKPVISVLEKQTGLALYQVLKDLFEAENKATASVARSRSLRRPRRRSWRPT